MKRSLGVMLVLLAASTWVMGRTAEASMRAPPGRLFAERTLARVVLPPGARPSSPESSAGPPWPGVAHHEALRSFRVDESPQSVEAYLEHHLPRHWTLESTGSGGAIGMDPTYDRSYTVPVTGVHELQAQLNYEIRAAAGGSSLHVDGAVLRATGQSADVRAPEQDVVRVTGSRLIAASGDAGAVSAWADHAQAARIRTALAGLQRENETTGCAESPAAYEIDFLRTRSSRPDLTVTEACGGLGLSRGGRRSVTLAPDCAVFRAAVAVLPPGAAQGTRAAQRSAGCTRTLNRSHRGG